MEIQSNPPLPKIDLPIHKYRQQILQTIKQNTVTIICGQTGSGKTTQLPQFLLTSQYQKYDKIMISQPRRISAISLAERVAKQRNCLIGTQIGYSVRFQQKRDLNQQKTKVLFVTDGMAIRQMMVGKVYDIYVVDQAHQRSINTDVFLAVLKSMLKKNKQNINTINQKKKNSKTIVKFKTKAFKIVIMSATIDTVKFCQFFDTDAVINVQGRTYPTNVYNVFQPVSDYVTATFNTILQIHDKQKQGDILAFLTGQQQILTLKNQLNNVLRQYCQQYNEKMIDQNQQISQQFQDQKKSKKKYQIKPFQVMILYSALPYEYHMAVFKSFTGKNKPRRIILSTNIAETSVTIPGIRFVVDSGFMKVRMYQPQTRIQILSVVPISKANAQQRAGRAGRQSQGKCFRLYLHNDYEQLSQQILPQILRSQLSGPFLQLKAIGVPFLKDLEYVDSPSNQILQHSLNLLKQIDCITIKQGVQKITDKGYQISKLPLSPLQSNLLLLSLEQKYSCKDLMLSLISILSVDNLFYVGQGSSLRSNKQNKMNKILKKFTINNNRNIFPSDHLIKVNILHYYILSHNKKSFCKEHCINSKGIKRATQVRAQLADYLIQIQNQRKKKAFVSIQNQKQKIKEQELKTIDKYNTQKIKSFLECLQKGSLYNIGTLQKSGKYLICKTNQQANIHPQSVCFNINSKVKPSKLVFSYIVKTSKLYMRDITILSN